MGGYLKNNVLYIIYLEKYNATKKDCREYPAEPKNLFCDATSGLIIMLVANICINYRLPITQNLKGLDFDLSRSRGVNRIDTWPIRFLCKLQACEI